MKITILTLFDSFCNEYINSSIIKNAVKQDLVEIQVVNFRDFSDNKHKKVDDYQFGGGPGMVLKMQPIIHCLDNYKTEKSHVILTTPSGQVFSQEKACELAKKQELIIIAGHYEGFDARIEHFVDEEISIGDYVLTGGELPSLVMLDAIVRLIPNVINHESLDSESFNNNLLDYPVYTKPVDFRGFKVPEILLSGNHQKIDQYRNEQRKLLTKNKRNDLYQKYLSLKKGKNNESK